MKKLIALILILAFCLSATSCALPLGNTQNSETNNNNEIPRFDLAVASPVTIENFANFTLFKIETTKKVAASMGDRIYYENQKTGETYVDIVLDWTNLGTHDMSSEDIVTAIATGETQNTYHADFYAIETNNAQYVSKYENIAPLSTVRLHCAISVPETETNLSITLLIDQKAYVIPYTLGESKNSALHINPGEMVGNTNYATLTFLGVDYTDVVVPSDTSGSYSHYEIKNASNTYLVVKFDITNYTSTAKDAENYTNLKAVYANKYTYTGFTVVEDENQKGFNMYENILPLSTRTFYCLIEVPKTVTQYDPTITIAFNNQEFHFTYK